MKVVDTSTEHLNDMTEGLELNDMIEGLELTKRLLTQPGVECILHPLVLSCGSRTIGKGEHLSQSDMHKSIRQDVIHRMGLSEVANVTASVFPIIFERSCPWKGYGEHFQAHKGQEGDSEQPAQIYQGRSCLTHLVFFYDEMIGSADNGRTAGVDFRKTFDTVSYSILTAKSIALFSAFINDLNDRTECTLSKFMDDTKLGRAVDKLESRATIWKENNKLEKRADKNHKLQRSWEEALEMQDMRAERRNVPLPVSCLAVGAIVKIRYSHVHSMYSRPASVPPETFGSSKQG
ncbi:hypothetical protein QYF61_008671 [Mycteria americana]|uniref:Uncharacterized protein n=1 Tax=Mycteria americana TaxID=33587 RepID=A0AAN7NQE9_MYCAM|nr:hypothetical protein QYF61_008671 [Mycteria americana]